MMKRFLSLILSLFFSMGFFLYGANDESEKKDSTASAHKKAPNGTSVTIACYNVENWGKTDRWIGESKVNNMMKPAEECEAVVTIIKKINPDILGLMEVLRTPDDANIKSIRNALKKAGVDYPYMATVIGEDKRAQNLLLSRYPITKTIDLNKDAFTMHVKQQVDGKWKDKIITRRSERGFIDAIIEINPHYQIEVFVAHLKSKRPAPNLNDPKTREFGEDIIRRNEALLLRSHMMERYDENKEVNLIVMGDLNDIITSPAIRTLLGNRGSPVLTHRLPLKDYLGDEWTHFHYPEKAYNLIDYMIVSDGLMHEFVEDEKKSYVYREKGDDSESLKWSHASDHRPLVATFLATNLSLATSSISQVVIHKEKIQSSH
ncbi:MAG: endonuclease/exonuclease/phosphatase family protein [Verrucomicrobiae bacterium]|nr:endonuclease/exonuclease/phosphatase family protein [Verrucomicrobiae bacterium]